MILYDEEVAEQAGAEVHVDDVDEEADDKEGEDGPIDNTEGETDAGGDLPAQSASGDRTRRSHTVAPPVAPTDDDGKTEIRPCGDG